MTKEVGEDALEPANALLSRVTATQEVGQKDEVVMLRGSDKASVLEERSKAEKDG